MTIIGYVVAYFIFAFALGSFVGTTIYKMGDYQGEEDDKYNG